MPEWLGSTAYDAKRGQSAQVSHETFDVHDAIITGLYGEVAALQSIWCLWCTISISHSDSQKYTKVLIRLCCSVEVLSNHMTHKSIPLLTHIMQSLYTFQVNPLQNSLYNSLTCFHLQIITSELIMEPILIMGILCCVQLHACILSLKIAELRLSLLLVCIILWGRKELARLNVQNVYLLYMYSCMQLDGLQAQIKKAQIVV